MSRQHSNLNPYPPGTVAHDVEEFRLAWRVLVGLILESLRGALRLRL